MIFLILIFICAAVLTVGANQRGLLPGTRTYKMALQEREARHRLILARISAVENGILDKQLHSLERAKDGSS